MAKISSWPAAGQGNPAVSCHCGRQRSKEDVYGMERKRTKGEKEEGREEEERKRMNRKKRMIMRKRRWRRNLAFYQEL